MIETLTISLRFAGAGLLLLAFLHFPISRHLKWREEGARLSPLNGSIFRVHAFFICVILVIMGLPCLLEPRVFLDPSCAGRWFAWSFSAFWAIRLYVQLFVYRKELWIGKRGETALHWFFTAVWTALSALFAACALWQAGSLR
jgi:hypothetical protein